jgi:hypothetical protein
MGQRRAGGRSPGQREAARREALTQSQIQEEYSNIGQARQIQQDPRVLAYQRNALQKMQEASTTAGTAEAQAYSAQEKAKRQQDLAGQRRALDVMQQRRGMGGQALAGQLAAQQGYAQRADMAGLRERSMQEQRQLQAVQAMGQMAGQQQGQSMDIAKFNEELRMMPEKRRMELLRLSMGARGQLAAERAQDMSFMGSTIGGSMGAGGSAGSSIMGMFSGGTAGSNRQEA